MTDGFSFSYGVDAWLQREDDVDETTPWTECYCLRCHAHYWSSPDLRGCPTCNEERDQAEQDRQRGAA